MQRVDLRGCRVRAFLALVAVVGSAFLTAGFDGSAPSARNAPAHVCPPMC